MKKIYSGTKTLLAFALLIISSGKPSGLFAQTATTLTYSYTGSVQTFTVPSCVTSISIDARGAQGAQANDRVPTNSQGGLGGRAVGVLPVTTGQVLYIYVGGAGNINGTGGYNGGGTGGVSTAGGSCFGGPAGGGGGASDVRTGGTALTDRVIVAGGGGGSGRDYCNGTCQPCGCGGSGGGGGGLTGQAGIAAGNCGFGYPGLNTNGGGAGSGTAGGPGGIGDNGGTNGTAGVLGVGGNGGAGTYDVAGGGGGGGYYGGGGGGSASSGSGVGGGGGGGGSSWPTSTVSNFQAGNGLVILNFDYNGAGINVAVSSTSICAGTAVTMTASNQLSYTWTPSGSNATTYSAMPSSTTVYTVQGTNNLGCISTTLITVFVDPAVPVLTVANTASATGGICPNTTVNLLASGATSYTWTGGVSNGVTFAPTLASTYIVTGANACGSTTAATSVSVHSLPSTGAVASQPTICSGNSTNLTGVGNATNYVWYSSPTSTAANGTNWFPPVNTAYTVVGTSAQSCTNSAVIIVTVVATPSAPAVSSPPLICNGNSATLSAGVASGYTWTTPSGTQNNSVIVVSPVTTTTYNVTKANGNCVSIQVVTVNVNQLPNIFAIVSPTLTCSGQTATMQAAGASTYSWSTTGPPAWSATGAVVYISPTVTTNYTLTASDGTCVNTTTASLSVDPIPTISIVPTASVICRGDQVSLTANGGINYTWTTVGINSNTNAVTITETPNISTLYSVTGDNSFGCTSVGQQVVVVNNTPTLNITSNKPLVCSLAPANLTVTGANVYQWDANANNATTSVITVNPPTTTIYTVTGTFVQTQCSSTKTIQVAVFLPTFAVNSPTSSCLGGNINLIASGALSYTWNGNQPFAQINVSPPTATVYMVSATSVSAGVQCVSSNSVQVSIYSNPTVTAVPERTQICRYETTNLLGGGAATYVWNTTQTGSAVPVSPIQNTTYTVTGTDQNGCIGTGTVLLRVSTCIGIDERTSQKQNVTIYPNPSTGDFNIRGVSDLELQLSNELGQHLRTISLSKANNFAVTVSDLPPGIYIISGKNGEEAILEKIIISK